MGAKDDILARIAAAKATAAPLVRPPVVVPSTPRHEVIGQFAEYAAEYKAGVVRTMEAELREAIATALAARTSRRVLVAPDFPASYLPDGLEIVRDDALSHAEIDTAHAVVTLCAVAIAETGTVVLDAGVGQGRRAITLIPDHHVCIVREAQIVASVPEAVAALREAVLAGRPQTWISGPSATSDIELSRVEGVHGPRNLDILIVA
ncbi:MAG: LutC/YkgG family protein [Fimbriimonas sp.]